VEFGPSFRGVPFAVIQWRMAPHPCCRRTAVRKPVSARWGGTPFPMRETRRQIVSPRRISTLPATRDNIHCGDGSFSFVGFQPDKPKDPRAGLCEAVWTGMQL